MSSGRVGGSCLHNMRVRVLCNGEEAFRVKRRRANTDGEHRLTNRRSGEK